MVDSQTRILCRDGSIVVQLGQKRFRSHLAMVKSFLVRRYHKSTNEWILPLESAPEVFTEFDGMPDVGLDPQIEVHAGRLKHLQANKLSLPSSVHADLVKTPCLDHQRAWLAWSSNFKACANLSEQGSGKSKMALDWVDLKDCELVLIVCRNSNVYKWGRECTKHSDYRPFVLKGTRRERQEKLRAAVMHASNRGPAAAIINYEFVAPFINSLKGLRWHAIILDESTAIKNTRAKRTKALIALGQDIKYRLILTGTPLVNSPMDAFGQFFFVNPGVLGTNEYAYKNRYMVMGGYGGYQILGYKNLEELQDKIERFSFRVLKKDCIDAPPKVYEHLEIEQTSEFAKKYKQLVSEVVLEIGDQMVDNTLAISRINRCLQFCDGFLYRPDEGAERFTSPKDEELLNFLSDHFQSKDKVIVWGYFRETMRRIPALIAEEFPEVEVRSAMGGTPANVSSATVDWFNESHTKDRRRRCICLQSSAFMHGIDLACDTAIYYSRSWNNEEWLQTQDRIHGINRGGGKYANYIVLSIQGTAEESVDKALKRKKGLSDFVLRDVDELASFLRGMVHLGGE